MKKKQRKFVEVDGKVHVVHPKGNTQPWKKKKSSEQAVAEIKAQVLKYVSVQERFSLVKGVSPDGRETELLVLEEGRGVVDSWNLRKVDWLQGIIKQREIEEAREQHLTTQSERSIERQSTFGEGMQVVYAGNKGLSETYFLHFHGQYNEKAEIKIVHFSVATDTETGKQSIESWEEKATVWTDDIKPMNL